MRSARVYSIVSAVILLLLGVALIGTALRPPPSVVYQDSFLSEEEEYVTESAGWTPQENGLGVAAYARAIRGYQFPKHRDQRVLLTLKFNQPEGGTNRVHIKKPDPRGQGASRDKIWDNRDVVFDEMDLTEFAGEEGLFLIFLLAEGGESAELVLEQFAIRFEPTPPSIHWASLCFFVGLAMIAYAIAFYLILPTALAGARTLSQGNPRYALPLLIAAVVLLAHPEHRIGKNLRFDDFSAVGVAAHLKATGFDPSAMVFRSRIRPALTAWILPWTQLLPHRLVSSTFTPSDRKERMFFFYDREGPSFGTRIYPEQSAFFAVLMLMGLLMLAQIVRSNGLSEDEAALIFLFGALFSILCLYNSISSSAGLTTTIAAGLVAWRAWRNPSPIGLILAGLVFSFTILLKETFVVLGAGIALYQVWGIMKEDEKKRRIAHFITFCGSAAFLPLIYYLLIIDTGFAELPANHQLLYFHEKLHSEYEPLTLKSGLKTYWQAFSVGLPLAALGLMDLFRRRKKMEDADRFFLCWFAGSLLTLTMPYIFPRFLIFSFPPIAYLATKGFNWLLVRIRPAVP